MNLTLLMRENIRISKELTWQELGSLPTLEAAVKWIGLVYDFHRHPYLIWMQQKTTNRDEFRCSQLPFRFAVESFSQALAAVLAKIPLLEDRLPLLENIMEEHGRGSILHSHKSTFQQYLQTLGTTTEEFDTPCTTSVLAFNQSIWAYCLTQPPEAGAALLGIIEYLYVEISQAIADTIQVRGWVAPDSQSHYVTHSKLDTKHASDLLLRADFGWHEARSRTVVSQGLILGAHYLWSLYNDLLPSL